MYSALQQGTISAVYTTFDAFVNEKMVEVAPNVMVIPSYGAYIWVANKAWWEQQPAADRKVMDESAARLAREYHKQIWAESDKFVAAIKKGGGKISDPAKDDPNAVKTFRAALAGTYDRTREKFGKDTVNAILSSPLSGGRGAIRGRGRARATPSCAGWHAPRSPSWAQSSSGRWRSPSSPSSRATPGPPPATGA